MADQSFLNVRTKGFSLQHIDGQGCSFEHIPRQDIFNVCIVYFVQVQIAKVVPVNIYQGRIS